MITYTETIDFTPIDGETQRLIIEVSINEFVEPRPDGRQLYLTRSKRRYYDPVITLSAQRLRDKYNYYWVWTTCYSPDGKKVYTDLPGMTHVQAVPREIYKFVISENGGYGSLK